MKALILVCLNALLIVACSPATPPQSIYVTPQCINEQSQCLFDTSFGQLSVLFNVSKITTEQEFQMIVQGDGLAADTKVSAYLEGKDMYMGKIPLFFHYDLQQQYFVSDAILGSCSEEKMTWTMWLTIAEPNSTEKTQSLSIDFTSHRG